MSSNKHIPVLFRESIDSFQSSPIGTIVDCTLGGGGHTKGLLEAFPNQHILSCDVDRAAILHAKETLKGYGKRLELHHGNFAELTEVKDLPLEVAPPWSGVLMDLGYSSNQLEDSNYGMSFMIDGPIDMRLSRSGQTAWELLGECSAQELGDILKAYGEILGAHHLANKLKAAIEEGSVVNSTRSLAKFFEMNSRTKSKDKIHPATLAFQALRIAVNDELRKLAQFLDSVILKLKPGAIISVITFHSLEDRLVKRWGQKYENRLYIVTKKPVTASEDEIKSNPRARSAKLRVYKVR